MAKLKIKGLDVLLLIVLASLACAFSNQSYLSRTIQEDLLEKIENPHAGWYALKADLTLNLTTPDNQVATCRGKMIYQRLDQKILLECSNQKKQSLFVLKTSDRDFELYLPGKKTVFRGDIFDLENSEDFESHIHPLELYRALKPVAFRPNQTQIEAMNRDYIALQVFAKKTNGLYLSRRLMATRQGNVFHEIYFSPDEEPVCEIRRFHFRTLRHADSYNRIPLVYPRRILITSQKQGTKTELVFHKVSLIWSVNDEHWNLRVPVDTQVFHCKQFSGATANNREAF